MSSACCSTRTPSCSPAPRRRCSGRSAPTPRPEPPARSCSTRSASRSPARGACPASAPRWPRHCFCTSWLVTQSGGERTRRVGWAQSAALLVRREAAERIGYLDPAFFVYSDETDFCKRLGDAGLHTLYVPEAKAIHHEQLSTDRTAGSRRIVEFHRNRDLYMRKHHGPAAALAVRALTAFSYLPRALAALVLPGHDPRWYLLHASKAMWPTGEGIRELAG